MKKHSTLLALGILVISQSVPVTAHANDLIVPSADAPPITDVLIENEGNQSDIKKNSDDASLEEVAELSILNSKNEIKSTSDSEIETFVPTSVENLNDWMPDENLQMIVAQSVGKTVSDLTKADMPKLLSLNFNNLPKDTHVNFLGLEFAINLRQLDTTNIIATNIPSISIASNGMLYTRPNVLKQIKPQGNFSNIRIGSYDTYLSHIELMGIDSFMEDWNTDILTIFSTGMTDFSTLKLSDNLQNNSNVSIFSNDQPVLSSLDVKDSETNLFYSDDNLIDTQGNLLLSSLSNASYPLRLTAFNLEGVASYLTEGVDYTYTNKGISFNNIPNETAYIVARGLAPNRSSFSSNANVNYGVSFMIPVNYTESAKNVTVKYVDSKGNKIHDDKMIEGNVGDAYDTSSSLYQLSINGYNLDTDKIPLNYKGNLSDKEQNVTYVYKQNTSSTDKESSSGVDKSTSKNSDTSAKHRNNTEKSTSVSTEHMLPSTGSQSSVLTNISGALLLLTPSIVLILKKKKNEN